MKTLLFKLSYFLFLFIGFVSSKLSVRCRMKLGSFFGDLIRVISKKRTAITFDNIEKALPELSKSEINAIVRDSYRNISISICEMLSFKYLDKSDFYNYIEFEDFHILRDKVTSKKGAILMSGHFGNWELLAFAAGLLLDEPILIIVKPQSNFFIDRLFNEIRTHRGNKVVSSYAAALPIVKTIKNGGAIALLADQSATKDKDVFVDFFLRPAATYEAPADLALRFNVPMVAAFAIRQSDGTYKSRIIEIPHDDLSYNKNDILELTRRHVKALEDAIRLYPGLWSWQHRRWKHSPQSQD